MTVDTFPQLTRPLLDSEALRDINEIALWAGALLLSCGAETDRIEETVHRIGTGLGATWMDILVSPNALIVTSNNSLEFRTRVRRVPVLAVNMRIVDEVNTLSRRIGDGEIDRHGARVELSRISHSRHYNRWLVMIMVGVACAAFTRMIGGTPVDMLIAFVAASLGMFVRKELSRRNFNQLMVVVVTAFTATLIALAPIKLGWVPNTSAVLTCVLMLVPGVHLINSAEDLLKSHIVIGVARAVLATLIAACIAVGMILAMSAFDLPVL